jgi:hypothetical protein
MSLTPEQIANGLSNDYELFFPEQPDNPDMRESTSIWLFDENGSFGFPRIGIEGEAHSWENRLYSANFNLGGGRVLRDMNRGPVPSPFDADGRATVFGAGPLVFRCIEPFRKWQVSFDGSAEDGTVSQQISHTTDPENRVPFKFEAELTMVTPAWIQDNSPEKVARMSKAEAEEATSMGIGWRLEHMFRGQGQLTIDGKTRDFNAVGSRIKRQSIRPLNFFRGHVWQSALFPDGSAFGYIAYPPAGDGSAPYNDGYIFKDGKMYPARAVKKPWLTQIVEDGEDVSLELESELGITRISGTTAFSSFHIMETETAGFNLQQSGARYTWGNQSAYGMIERSGTDQQLEQWRLNMP